jgi:3-demethoxyubiquinol 3-hydroxylase
MRGASITSNVMSPEMSARLSLIFSATESSESTTPGSMAPVERVVLRHLAHQMEALRVTDEVAVRAISEIVSEEQQHHDRSASHVHASRFWLGLLSPVVAMSTEAVIWLGMRL